MASFNKKELATLQRDFKFLDSESEQKLPVSKLGKALRGMGLNPTEYEIKKQTLQFKPDDMLDFDAFLPIYQAVSRERSSVSFEELVEGLKKFDKDRSGLIKAIDLRFILTTLGEKLSKEEVQELFEGQVDSDGNINYKDFVKKIMES